MRGTNPPYNPAERGIKMITVKTEADRKQEAIKFCKEKIEELDRSIGECDYIEDVNGKLVYMPNSYPDERREYQHEKRQWEIMLNILTYEKPFTMLDW